MVKLAVEIVYLTKQTCLDEINVENAKEMIIK